MISRKIRNKINLATRSNSIIIIFIRQKSRVVLDEANLCKKYHRYFTHMWILGLVFVLFSIERQTSQIQSSYFWTHICYHVKNLIFFFILDEPCHSVNETIFTWRILYYNSFIASSRNRNSFMLGMVKWVLTHETPTSKRCPHLVRIFGRNYYALAYSTFLLHSPFYASLEGKIIPDN